LGCCRHRRWKTLLNHGVQFIDEQNHAGPVAGASLSLTSVSTSRSRFLELTANWRRAIGRPDQTDQAIPLT